MSLFIILHFSGSVFPSGMAEVFVVTWIAYFSLVLIVSKLSLHKARFASIFNPHIVCMSHIMLIYCIYFKVGTSWEFRKIFLIARRREVSLMDQSLVVCLLTSGKASLIFDITGVANSFLFLFFYFWLFILIVLQSLWWKIGGIH